MFLISLFVVLVVQLVLHLVFPHRPGFIYDGFDSLSPGLHVRLVVPADGRVTTRRFFIASR